VEDLTLFTPKCTLVPAHFFEPASSREILEEVVVLDRNDVVKSLDVPQYEAVLLYAQGASDPDARPELYEMLRSLPSCPEYNKILACWKEGYLFLAIAEGKGLRLANVYSAPDFTTAEYYIFLAMKSLQLNPEVSTICWRYELGAEDEMSLYRYFKSVERL